MARGEARVLGRRKCSEGKKNTRSFPRVRYFRKALYLFVDESGIETHLICAVRTG